MSLANLLEARRLVELCSDFDPEAYLRAVVDPVDPPAEHQLEVLPLHDIISAYSMTTWYFRNIEDSFEQAALYVARKFGLSFEAAWDQVECAYADYNSAYSHN